MALRRWAQTNNANANGSPKVKTPNSPGLNSSSAPGTPGSAPSSPRPRASYMYSPSATPSISSSTPFDWDAARSMKPAPYGSPAQGKRRMATKATGTPARKGVTRKKGLVERIRNIPSRVAFEIGMFPHNVPLPEPKTSAWLLGGTMHFLHLIVRISQVRKVPDADAGWEDMYRESEGSSWFDWTTPVSLLLIVGSVLNALYLFTRVRLYRLHHRADPIASPSAKFVSAHLDFEPLEPASVLYRVSSGAWSAWSTAWRFLLNMRPRPAKISGPKMSKVQQLDVWAPGDLETLLFCVYSPVHWLLWLATTSANWVLICIIMGGVSAQMWGLTQSFTILMRDKEIIAAEVMREYNDGFVYPRVNPIRKDVAVMTHQAETVNVWED
ncbi:hypothetical protein FIBSPDRAFT_1050381 [Athelia psychrophila]|uniref:Nuclear rim protein 1 n=1 Tax=Athelia psychrophila TaxID=1759441 RepID=A0A166AUH9_9AGAM|nr:hypothetical protein FIBSPDRAFT_1050381 [Fibularhizoctonia sp. CBS 109695]